MSPIFTPCVRIVESGLVSAGEPCCRLAKFDFCDHYANCKYLVIRFLPLQNRYRIVNLKKVGK